MYRFFTSIFGSQNQNLATAKSDKDYMSVYIPVYPMLIGAPEYISKVYHNIDGDHKIVDSRMFFQQLKKPTFNNMEILCSKDIQISSGDNALFDAIARERDAIAHSNEKNFLNSIGGITKKIRHQQKDARQISRLPYLREMLEKYLSGCELSECFWSSQRDYILTIRNGECDLEGIVKNEVAQIDKMLTIALPRTCPINHQVHTYIDEINYELITKYVIHYLTTTGKIDQ